ncbi:hypothetical protein [Novosphingobium rhizosphaerae]|uniref:hypothetical protein n=1 Tax=Novosphingobium rhizosphaerae TaxID=1551649 RepID=UPI003D816E5E
MIDHLVNAWNAFVALPVEHPDDVSEFRRSLHHLQALILMRSGRRTMNDPKA